MTDNLRPWVLLGFGAWILYAFGFDTLGGRLMLELDGVVVSRVPKTPSPVINADYLIRGADGRDEHYLAGPTDASLPRDLIVGTQIRKQRWQLAYELNGRHVDDFPTPFYGAVSAVGVGCIWGAIVLWRGASRTAHANKNNPGERNIPHTRLEESFTSPGEAVAETAPHKTMFIREPSWALDARTREESRRAPRWARWGATIGLIVWVVGIGMLIGAGEPNPFREADPATGHIYEINNHGDVVYVTASEYWKIYGTMGAGFALLVLSIGIGKVALRRRR